MKSYNNKIRQRKLEELKDTLIKLEILFETMLLAISYFYVWSKFYRSLSQNKFYGSGKFILMGIYGFLIIIVFLNSDCYRFGHLKRSDLVIPQCISCILVNFVTYWQLSLMNNHVIHSMPMIFLTGVDCLILFACIYVFDYINHKLYVPQHMLMICGNSKALTLKMKMDTRFDRYHIDKIVSSEDDLSNIVEQVKHYDAVILNDVSAPKRNDILKQCYLTGVQTYVTPKISDIILNGSQPITLFDTPLVLIRSYGLNMSQRVIKRFFDIVLCLIAMIPGAPIMLITAIAIKLEDGGPVFFKQRRVTKDGREFDILKFRSMVVDADKYGVVPTMDNDPRITKVGRVIRGPRIDELPQLINILKGDMSIVGPRPERVEHVKKYTEEMPEFIYRSKVKGGLTGYAQIYGKYNTTAYDKLRLDLMYIEKYSLLLDFKMILMTISVLFKKESTEGFDKQVNSVDLQTLANEQGQ